MSTQSSRILSVIFSLLGFLSFASVPVQAAVTSVTIGQSYALSVTADGTAPFTYQWYHDGVAMSGVTDSIYSGTAKASDAGVYYAKVTNSAGSASSDSVTLTFVASPVFTSQPASQAVTAGGTATFTVAASGSPAPTYQWLKNGVTIPGATGASCVLAKVTSADAGSYTVLATNSAGSTVSEGAVLSISAASVAPVMTKQPASQSVTSGGSVTFTAAASGSPAPTYKWRKNGVTISGATSASYSLSSVTSANAGSYSVVATNSAGSATSTNAVLTVSAAAVAPVFVTQPSSQSLKAGSSVSLSANASGSPAPGFQWKKNGSVISGATASSYTIASLVAADAGTYTVVATNKAGSATSAGAVLTVTAASSGLARTDFNNDGKTDILWQNIVTRECAVWFMDGTKQASSTLAGIYADQWKMSGTGDFNGDGQTDILCHNTATGEISLWLMTGTSVASKVSLSVQNLAWKVVGVGDFNRDGKPDVVLQNSSTREFSIWLMAGTKVASVVSLGKGAVDWEICGAGDFDGDGKSDLLWQNNVTGQTNLWLMSGTAVKWKAWIATRTLDWQVSGTGDFNGDGKSDILWQNVLTGDCSLWLMSTNTAKGWLDLGDQPVDWVIRN